MKYNLKLHLSQFLFILLVTETFTQNHSVGLSPFTTFQPPITRNYEQVGSRYWSQLSTAPTFQFGKSFMESCVIMNIGAAFPITFPGGLVNKGGTIYTWNQLLPYQLYMVDTVTGVHTLVFNMTGVPHPNFTGMTWDGTTMYGVSTNLSVSQIFTVNMTTGICTPLGTPSAVCAGAIFIAGRLNAGSRLYSVDIVTDNLYRWNKQTGVPTLIGSIGGDANFGQDAQFDNRDGALYWMSYVNSTPALRRLDTASGGSVILCTYPSQGTGIAISEPQTPFNPCSFWPRIVIQDNDGFNKPIPDLGIVRDTITVSGIPPNCTVCDLNLRIDTVLHTWDGDLTFTLNHLGATVSLITERGGSGDNFISTTLNDSALIPISSGTPPFTGEYRSENSLNLFNTQTLNGTWVLSISDGYAGDSGYLKQWTLFISQMCWYGGITNVEIPNEYLLEQNYPNPFNPATTINFSIPKAGNVEMKVYDLTGKEVVVLVNEFKATGNYSVVFDASNLASGVYFYIIKAGDFVDTKKMALIK